MRPKTFLLLLILILSAFNFYMRIESQRQSKDYNQYLPQIDIPYSQEVNILWNDDWESIPPTDSIIKVKIEWLSDRSVLLTEIP